MIETTVRVVRIEAGQAWFEPQNPAQCAGCASAKVCAMGAGASGAPRLGRIALDSLPRQIELHPGDVFVAGIEPADLLRALVRTIVVPLALAFAAGIAADLLQTDERLTVAATGAGLFFGLALATRLGRRSNKRLLSSYRGPAPAALTASEART